MSSAFRPSTRVRKPASHRPPLYAVQPSPKPTRPTTRARRSRSVAPVRPMPSVVRRLPVSRPIPIWLRWLIRLQRGSLVVVFLLAMATLLVYGSTVYTQQRWGEDFHKLKRLQRSERQLVAAGEMLKNQLAKQAELPTSGMVPRTTENTIFLPSSPDRPVQSVAPDTSKPEPELKKPLGY